MRKFSIALLLVLVFVLSSCVEPSIDYLDFELNPSIDTIELNSSYQDPGAVAKYGFKVLDVEVLSNTVDVTSVGVYEIIYQATYGSLIQTLKRIVTVVDETPPTIELNPGIDTIRVGTEWIDAGVTLSDESLMPIELSVMGDVGENPGLYVITYIATDTYGNQAQKDRIVYVIE